MQHSLFSSFVSDLMLHEIVHALPQDVDEKKAKDFGLQVLDRFRNTNIEHRWLGITLQYTSKMKIRNIPVLLNHYKLFKKPPENFAWGFAAYLLFMKAIKIENDNYFGQLDEGFYLINDGKADYFYQLWKSNTPSTVAARVIRDKELWGTDLSKLKGFEASVQLKLQLLINNKFITMLDHAEIVKPK
jgi:tagaturonate reductase